METFNKLEHFSLLGHRTTDPAIRTDMMMRRVASTTVNISHVQSDVITLISSLKSFG